MKSKSIYLLTIVFIAIVSIVLYRFDSKTKEFRVHQHRMPQWQEAADTKAAEGTKNEEGTESTGTKLPIIKIETGGQKVPGTPVAGSDGTLFETAADGEKTIKTSFELIDGQKGNNQLTDEPSVVSEARIRYRGNSSRFFDKKSYSVHLVKEDDSENPIELAGMSAHDEWVLNGPFLDRTLMRNYLCLNIAGEIMEYAPNVRYCELYVDGQYQGLYLLIESVGRGEGRIDIPKPEKNSDVTSYIVRWDRTGKGDHELNNYTFYTYKNDVSSLDIRYPGSSQITEGRFQYIEDDISKAEKAIYSSDLTDRYKGAANYIDINSFAEYFVINEFFRNVDAGRFSTFYYKDARGKLKTCVWDFNNACDNYIDYVWGEAGFTMQDAPWFGQLLKDERFVTAVTAKYRTLRKSVLSDEYLLSYVDETVEWLGSETDKNFEKWGYVFDLSEYNGMNYLTPVERNDTSYEGAVKRLKDFLTARGKWLDEHIDTLFQYCHDSKNVNEMTR